MKLLPTVVFAMGLLIEISSVPARAEAADDLEAVLRFEVEHSGETPAGWGGGPPETIRLDGKVIHEGRWAARLTRNDHSPSDFSTITKSIPIDFEGTMVSLIGSLRLENVTGFAGLWMREDASRGAVAFDNMQRRGLKGTIEWAEYRIDLPLQEDADELYFGALISGEGILWVDDLRILVDGEPLATAPRRKLEPTILDLDHEFDDGSGIDVDRLSTTQVEALVRLGKVWGFLKYHHPRVTAGELHWDYELFRVLPPILRAEDAATANGELVSWLDELGEIPPCDPCASAPGDTHLAPDLDWISDRNWLGHALCERLDLVHRRRHAGNEQFYVKKSPDIGNALFHHELPYTVGRLDAGYRILALLRFWNVVEYWFPYRDVIGEDWDAVLAEFLPRVVEATESLEYQKQMLQLVARVHDSHANLWGRLEVRPPRGECGLPVQLRFVQRQAVVTASDVSADSTALRVGDVIEILDGRTVDDLVAEWTPFYAASNEPARLRDIARQMSRGDCGPCSVTVDREGQRIELSEERRPRRARPVDRRWHHRPGETFQWLGDDVAYLKLAPLELHDCADYVRRAKTARGLILDLRNYPTNFVVFELGQHLVTEPTPFARFTNVDPANPGAFHWTDAVQLEPRAPHFGGKVVILVDEVSQSQAEYTSMAFRAAPGAVVVGSTTAGADGNVSPLPLPGGLRTTISGIGVFYPDETPTQRIGIVPDVEVKPTVRGLREGRDEVLEEALRQILGDVSDEDLRARLAIRPQ